MTIILISNLSQIFSQNKKTPLYKGETNLWRRWWDSNPRALADLSHFECDLLDLLSTSSFFVLFEITPDQ